MSKKDSSGMIPLIPKRCTWADLHPVTQDDSIDASRSWCGPCAISALTGQPQQHAAQWIAKRRRKGTARGVRGTSTGEVRSCLSHAGLHTYRLQSFKPGDRPTLAKWLRKRGPRLRKATCLVNAGDHWIVVKGRKLADSHHWEPVFIKQAHCRRKRVHDVYIVYRDKHKKVQPILRAA